MLHSNMKETWGECIASKYSTMRTKHGKHVEWTKEEEKNHNNMC